MSREKIVAFAALTQGDLDRFGKNLKRVLPISDEPHFAELLDAIDRADRESWREEERRDALASLKSG